MLLSSSIRTQLSDSKAFAPHLRTFPLAPAMGTAALVDIRITYAYQNDHDGLHTISIPVVLVPAGLADSASLRFDCSIFVRF